MSQFFISVKRQLKKYGVDIKVWSADSFEGKPAYPGGPTKSINSLDDLKDEDAELRHEPVLPISSKTSQLASLIGGGRQLNGDLLWLSSKKYPMGTVVEVPTQGGRYKVTNLSNYQDYSELVEYELKGDDQNGINE